ncbi:MAG: amidase family protein, partial [Actinomycetota bacterium]|nr:amidase family protein [Actinomycetota bacterium]
MAGEQRMELRELAASVRERRVSAHELVSESLRRIDALDPDLGAVVALRADEALEDARGLDSAIADGAKAGALAGLPLLVKDMTDVAGMRTTFGSRAFAGAPA